MRAPCLLFGVLLVTVVYAIPIDNGVEGEPEIECGPVSITINFNTRNAFEGHVYVKGLYDQEGCRNDEGGRQVAGIELPFDSCNVARTRSLTPRGIFVTTTVVISFHPQFVTKVDRAYRIQCFYMEADKTVSTQLEVSDLTTAFQTAIVPMPVCRYEILDGGPTGQPITFATIGQQVYHKWTCDSETTDTFCAVVHSCTVDDGNGDTIQILNEDGCALDKFLLNNLEYPTDLMAGQEAHVYKYADRSQLFYQCQISITIKEPHAECPRPQCSEPNGFGAVKSTEGGAHTAGPAPPGASPPPRLFRRRRRSNIADENTMDVRAEISALEISEMDNANLTDFIKQRNHLSKIVPMPVCRYEILGGGPTGQPDQFCDNWTTNCLCVYRLCGRHYFDDVEFEGCGFEVGAQCASTGVALAGSEHEQFLNETANFVATQQQRDEELEILE